MSEIISNQFESKGLKSLGIEIELKVIVSIIHDERDGITNGLLIYVDDEYENEYENDKCILSYDNNEFTFCFLWLLSITQLTPPSQSNAISLFVLLF